MPQSAEGRGAPVLRQLIRLPFGADVADVVAGVAQDGGVILTGALSRPQVAAVNAELDAVMGVLPQGNFGSEEDNYLARFMGARTKRMQHCVKHSPTYREDYVASAILADYVAAILKGRPGSHALVSSQAIEIYPGEAAQVLHRDGGGFMEALDINHASGVEVLVNTLLALTDVTEAMGATRVVPGSNRWSDFKASADQDQSVPATLEAGDVLLFSGKLLHGGGANTTTDRSRRVVSTAWSLSFLTPEEAWPFVITPEEARSYPRAVRAAMGFHSFTFRGEEPGFLWRVDNSPLEEHFGYRDGG